MQQKILSKGGIIWKWDLKHQEKLKKTKLLASLNSLKSGTPINLNKRGEQLYKSLEDTQKLTDKDSKWSLNMLAKGTLNDRVSALRMLVEKNPELSLKWLN